MSNILHANRPVRDLYYSLTLHGISMGIMDCQRNYSIRGWKVSVYLNSTDFLKRSTKVTHYPQTCLNFYSGSEKRENGRGWMGRKGRKGRLQASYCLSRNPLRTHWNPWYSPYSNPPLFHDVWIKVPNRSWSDFLAWINFDWFRVNKSCLCKRITEHGGGITC